jgi:hypothetical protein
MAGEHLRKLESTVLDLQCKSMKNSLVLTGLAYSKMRTVKTNSVVLYMKMWD